MKTSDFIVGVFVLLPFVMIALALVIVWLRRNDFMNSLGAWRPKLQYGRGTACDRVKQFFPLHRFHSR
jgi:hypothetical protein